MTQTKRKAEPQTPGATLEPKQIPPQADDDLPDELKESPHVVDEKVLFEAEVQRRVAEELAKRTKALPPGVLSQADALQLANERGRAVQSVDGWVCPEPPAEPLHPVRR